MTDYYEVNYELPHVWNIILMNYYIGICKYQCLYCLRIDTFQIGDVNLDMCICPISKP